MLTFGKKMLCVYGLRPNQSNSNADVLPCERRTPENFLKVRKKVIVRVRLFPRESQPSSSTCWWTITLKSRGVFRKHKHCKVTESVGTKTFTSTEGRYSIDGENLVINGHLEDDSLEGKYYLLRLKHSKNEERNLPAVVLYEGTLARSKHSTGVEGDWETTHDAMIFGELSTE